MYYDADIAFASVVPEPTVVAGQNSAGRVPARRQLGYIQRIQCRTRCRREPAGAVLTPDQFNELLTRTGHGGPVDCTIRIGASKQTKRVTSVETARAGKPAPVSPFEFAVVANGSLVLPAAAVEHGSRR